MTGEQAEDVAVIDVELLCPVCGDRAEQRPPLLWLGPEDARPEQRHVYDASALCAEYTPDGMTPAVAVIVEITAETDQ